ncbi:MAG TPA: lamin tail domain-containing protein [Candidatus Saccharimonadales bacterium]|nr:lamin tail domain-containing protein [Candidatus Saccharimonadales bacterium]
MFFSAPSFMKTFSARTVFSILLSLFFFLNPLTTTTAASSYINVTAPSQVVQNQPFEVSVDLYATPNTNYYIKARLGIDSTLTKGLTLEPASGIWLSDTVSWDHFQSLSTNADGNWSGKIQVKTTQTAPVGNYNLKIRIKEVSSDKSIDSDSYQIVVAAPSEPTVAPQANPTPKVAGGQPILNEFMAAPASGNEWVEIKNKGTAIADLSGWKVDDEPGKSTPQVLAANTFINPGGFLVVNFASSKLNDSADQVRLLKPDDSVVEGYSYKSPQKGKSFAKDSSGEWFIADPTPGAENPAPPTAVGSALAIEKKASSTTGNTSATTQEELGESAALPTLGIATRSATVAAVAVAKGTSSKNGRFLNYLLELAGVLLIISAIAIVFKEPLLKVLKKYRLKNLPLGQT